jgi:hypothetical protein
MLIIEGDYRLGIEEGDYRLGIEEGDFSGCNKLRMTSSEI